MDRRQEQHTIAATLAGDREAAARLVRAHQQSLYAFMLRTCGRPDVAEDVTQEALVRALTNLHRFDNSFRFSTWLFTIAKRLHLNAAQKRAPAFDTDTVGQVAQSRPHQAAGDPEAAEDREATRARLDEALRLLPDVQRESLVLFHQCGWPIARIAEHLVVPQGTVKSHLHRARRKVRATIERLEEAERQRARTQRAKRAATDRTGRGIPSES